jgi:hypothetical protein
MADFQHKNMSGSVFANEYKKEDKHPDLKGKAMIDGVLYDVAIWKKNGNRGEWFSLAFSIPKPKPNQQQPAPQQSRPAPRPQTRPTAQQVLNQPEYNGEPGGESAGPAQDDSIPFSPHLI